METSSSPWLPAFQDFLELIYGSEFGTVPFWIVFAVSIASTVVFGWFICNLLLGGKAGFIATLIAFVLIFAGGVASYIAIELYVLDSITNETLISVLPWVGLGLGIFIVTLTLGRLVLGLSEVKSLFGVLLTGAAAGVCVFMTAELARETDDAIRDTGERIEEREREYNVIE